MRVVQVAKPNAPFELVERPMPEPGPREVRIKVEVKNTRGVLAQVAAAIADTNRTDADRMGDANRHPAEMMTFAGFKAGDKVEAHVTDQGHARSIIHLTAGGKMETPGSKIVEGDVLKIDTRTGKYIERIR